MNGNLSSFQIKPKDALLSQRRKCFSGWSAFNMAHFISLSSLPPLCVCVARWPVHHTTFVFLVGWYHPLDCKCHHATLLFPDWCKLLLFPYQSVSSLRAGSVWVTSQDPESIVSVQQISFDFCNFCSRRQSGNITIMSNVHLQNSLYELRPTLETSRSFPTLEGKNGPWFRTSSLKFSIHDLFPWFAT